MSPGSGPALNAFTIPDRYNVKHMTAAPTTTNDFFGSVPLTNLLWLVLIWVAWMKWKSLSKYLHQITPWVMAVTLSIHPWHHTWWNGPIIQLGFCVIRMQLYFITNRSRLHGMLPKVFHDNCDSKGASISIYRTQTFIYGGFMSFSVYQLTNFYRSYSFFRVVLLNQIRKAFCFPYPTFSKQLRLKHQPWALEE